LLYPGFNFIKNDRSSDIAKYCDGSNGKLLKDREKGYNQGEGKYRDNENICAK